MTIQFSKATKAQSRARIALIGPSGSGKTYTGLRLATTLSTRVAVIDTERGSASKYADEFNFDTLALTTFNPLQYIEAIHAAAEAGYDVLLIDSLSHAWFGREGALELADRAAKRSKSQNTFTAWSEVTPLQSQLMDAIIQSSLHIIATLRTKTDYIITTDEKGKMVPKKIGLAPIQRQGFEYEFDIVADLDLEHTLTVFKTRCRALDNARIALPGPELAKKVLDWLKEGMPLAAAPESITTARVGAESKPIAGNGSLSARPANLDTVRGWLRASQKKHLGRQVSNDTLDAMRGLMNGTLNQLLGGDERRGYLLAALWDAQDGSSKKLTVAQISAMLDWLALEHKEDGTYEPTAKTELARLEAEHIISGWQRAQGQLELETAKGGWS